MLEQAAGLSANALLAIGELERDVVEADGGRLKLEWGRLRQRAGDRVEDLLWWEDARLLGFVGLYSFGSTLELAGMVAPDARGRGIGSALLDVAVELCRELDYRKTLLIVPRPSAAGRRLAADRGGFLDHSEHALVLAGDPISRPDRQDLGVRQATAADLGLVARLLEDAFGAPAPKDLGGRLETPRGRTLVFELSGSVVGTLRLNLDGDEGRISGLVIDPSWRGRGIGRDALRRACGTLRAEGARQIGLEVEVSNDRALALYRSVGFRLVMTEDYFALPLR